MPAPGHGDAFENPYHHIRRDAQKAVDDDAHHEGGHLLEAAGLGDEVADSQVGRDGLCEDQGDDGDPGGEPEAVEMDGRASGMITLRTRPQPRSPNVRAASTTLRSTLRTPLETFRYMGVRQARAIRSTLDVSPIPNQMMKRKMSAGKGSVRNIWSEESKISSPRAKRPTMTPRSRPTPPPMRRPNTARLAEMPMSPRRS